MKVAVEGCAHGDLDTIYKTIQFVEEKERFKIDLLLCCGDFQSVRNINDLTSMAVPPNYRKLNTFYKYYSGEKKAPVLTIFIGGNHEASSYLAELPYGGWVCPNIYYMGYAGILNVGGLRIGGLSGIYKGNDYLKGHFEMVPFNEATKRSIYHIRNVEVFKLKQIRQPIDIFMSHDWPRNVWKHGPVAELLKNKPFLKEDIVSGKLGSRPAEELLKKLKPAYWFAAHLHVKFAAVVPHSQDGPPKYTKFLALDKCLPQRKFLQILNFPHEEPLELHYDPEWLCILRSTNHLLSLEKGTCYMPGPGCSQRWDFQVREEEMSALEAIFQGDFKVPLNFEQTDPPHNPLIPSSKYDCNPFPQNDNPQTMSFAKKLGITDPLLREKVNTTQTVNPDEILVETEDPISFSCTSEYDSSTTDSILASALTYANEESSASQDDSASLLSPEASPFPPQFIKKASPPAYHSPSCAIVTKH